MTTYLGNQKVRIYLNGIAYRFNLPSLLQDISDIILESSDDYLFADIEGVYLTVQDIVKLLSSDNHRLKDRNGLYLNCE